jgi:SAM-dependent methyltransferase
MEGLSDRGRSGASAAGATEAAGATDAVSPYSRADLYDLLFQNYAVDLGFYLDAARAAQGPVLDVACGTGRVLFAALEAGLDVDGLDLSRPMLDRLEANARERGVKPRVQLADMRSFRMPRRYACVMIPFNAFAHNLTGEDQLATLARCREHLVPGGRLVFDVFSATQAMLADPVSDPVLELETPHPLTGRMLRLYDARRLDFAAQTQHSHIEIQELGERGEVARSDRFVTLVRWVYPSEMELLLRLAGFARFEISGGFDDTPVERHEGSIVVSAWNG